MPSRFPTPPASKNAAAALVQATYCELAPFLASSHFQLATSLTRRLRERCCPGCTGRRRRRYVPAMPTASLEQVPLTPPLLRSRGGRSVPLAAPILMDPIAPPCSVAEPLEPNSTSTLPTRALMLAWVPLHVAPAAPRPPDSTTSPRR